MFCILENDTKTYWYFKRYIECFEAQLSPLELDNTIQGEELLAHLRNNNLSTDNTAAKLEWIARYGQAFREYLNTIKLVYFLCKVSGQDPSEVDQDRFIELEGIVNRERNCLATIF